MKLATFAAAMMLTAVSLNYADARGKCDGIHRCRCGTTQANHFGLPWVYKGINLKQAIGWVKAFRRTTIPKTGIVVYQRRRGGTGHVSRIVGYSGSGCIATVTDDAGTYERNICKRGAIYLDVRASSASIPSPADRFAFN